MNPEYHPHRILSSSSCRGWRVATSVLFIPHSPPFMPSLSSRSTMNHRVLPVPRCYAWFFFSYTFQFIYWNACNKIPNNWDGTCHFPIKINCNKFPHPAEPPRIALPPVSSCDCWIRRLRTHGKKTTIRARNHSRTPHFPKPVHEATTTTTAASLLPAAMSEVHVWLLRGRGKRFPRRKQDRHFSSRWNIFLWRWNLSGLPHWKKISWCFCRKHMNLIAKVQYSRIPLHLDECHRKAVKPSLKFQSNRLTISTRYLGKNLSE